MMFPRAIERCSSSPEVSAAASARMSSTATDAPSSSKLWQMASPMPEPPPVSPHCFVFLAGVRAALEADPALAGGDYEQPPEAGLRAVGRVYAGWALSQAFYKQGLYRRMGFDSLDAFLVDFWEAFFLGLDANDVLSQLHTWQSAHLGDTPGYDGDLTRALGDIRARAILAPGEKDLYFPPEDMAWEAEQMPVAELAVIAGVWGHFSDSGVDPACCEAVRGAVRRLLAR